MFSFIVLFIAAFNFSYSAMPKPQSRPPAGLGGLQVPTAKEGGSIPVLFGTRELKGPNCVWYGDLSTSAVKKSGGKK